MGKCGFPPCQYCGDRERAGPAGEPVRNCSLLDAAVTACECKRYRAAGECETPESTTASADSGHYQRGDWRAIILNWPGKGMPVGLAKSMRSLGWDVTELRRGGQADWKDTCVSTIRDTRPQLLITVQRFYPGQFAGQIKEACNAYNCATLVMDFGVAVGQAHYGTSIFDPQGDNFDSTIAGRFDEIAATEGEWITAALPKVDAIRDTLRERAARCPPELLAKHGLDKLPPTFAFLILQKTDDAVLRYDATGVAAPKGLATQVLARCRVLGLPCVVKPHPFDSPRRCPAPGPVTGGVALPRISGEDNHLLSAWLLCNASHIITVNSTMMYQAMAVGTPVTTLGQGWFSGNDVTHEQWGVSATKFSLPEEHDAERCRRFVALMLSRQLTAQECEQPALVERLLRRFEQPAGRSVLSTVYAANRQQEAHAQDTLQAARGAVDGPIVAACDLGPKGFAKWLAGQSVTYAKVSGGKPPRMNRLMGEGLLKCRGDLVWTVEQGTTLNREACDKAEAIMRSLPPEVASLSLESVNDAGKRNFPSTVDFRDRGKPYRPRPELLRIVQAKGRKPYNTFNATLWRYHALSRVDWTKCRPLSRCDVDAGAQLHDQGWVHLAAPGLTAIHKPHVATKGSLQQGPAASAILKAQKPLVSIMAMTCGRLETTRKWLPKAVENLGHDNVEFLIWDNGSIDGTAEWLASHPWRVPPTIILHPTNIGGLCMERALQHCNGDYLYELGDDCEIPPGALGAMLEVFEKTDKQLGPLVLDYIWQCNKQSFASRWPWAEAIKLANGEAVLSGPTADMKRCAGGPARLTPMELVRQWKFANPYANDTRITVQTQKLGWWHGSMLNVGSAKGIHHCGRRSAETVRGGVVYHDGHDAR